MTATLACGRTAWRSAAVATGAGVLALAGAGLAVQRQAVALDVTFQERPSQFSTSGLAGSDVAFGTVPTQVSDGAGGTTPVPVLRGGLSKARLDGLCISQRQEMLGATYTLRVTAGDGKSGTHGITSSSATFDLTEVSGGSAPGIALGGTVQIGQTAGDVTTVPGVDDPLRAPGSGRYLAIDASSGELSDVRGTVYGFAISEAASIPGLTIEILPGDKGCHSSDLPS